MKKKGFVLLMMVFLLLSVLPASAAEQRVFDNADLLTAEEEQNLQQSVRMRRRNMILILHTSPRRIPKLINKGIRRTILYRTESGRGEDYSGAIFVLDMGEREGQLVTCGEAMEMITDADTDAIWDEISGYFSNGDYYGGMEQLWWDVDSFVRIISLTAQKADQNRMRFSRKVLFRVVAALR